MGFPELEKISGDYKVLLDLMMNNNAKTRR
jgi:hypothetical protein